MNIDCHVHVCAFTPGHGILSHRLMNTLPFRFMRWRLGMIGADEGTEMQVERTLGRLLDETPEIDAAAILAFDGVYTNDGRFDAPRTHFYVSNNYARQVASRHRKMLFAASVNPYRKDAVAELERCVTAGAVLMKWLPSVQGFDPADERCLPFYEALAHHKLPLLSHTGGEKSLFRIDDALAEPHRLIAALERGVTVIAAHCGTRSSYGERDTLDEFIALAEKYENLYGDTAALNLPARWHAFERVLGNKVVRNKLVHGSDWPIIALPNPRLLGLASAWEMLEDPNWLRRDVHIKQRLGLEDAYFARAATLLKLK